VHLLAGREVRGLWGLRVRNPYYPQEMKVSELPAVIEDGYIASPDPAPAGSVLGIKIPGLTARPTELGRIRMGSKGAKGMPMKGDRFRITSPFEEAVRAIAGRYGGEVSEWTDPMANPPRQWQVTVESDSIDVVLPSGAQLSQSLECWDKGGCTVRTDGITDLLTGAPWRGPTDFEGLKAAGIKPTTRLSVMLPGIPGFGVWRLESHGWNAAAEIAGVIDVIRMAGLSGQLHVGRLTLADRTSKKSGQTNRYKVPVLMLDATPEQLVEASRHMAALANGTVPSTLEGPKPRQLHVPNTVDLDDPFGLDAPAQSDTLMSSADAKRELLDACDGDREQAKALWGNRGSNPISPAELQSLLDQVATVAEIIEADLFAIEGGAA
jgi:hypothetical protein